MPKTLDDLQNLLTAHGYACKRLVDVIVATTVPTKIYRNPAGEKALEIYLTIDRPNDCVAVEVMRAFELRETAHKEAVLACLMTATGRTPLLRPALEPEGTVRLRIDCTCGRNGARDGDVLRAVALLPSFVDAWYPQVSSALQLGQFDANEVAHLNLMRMGRSCSARPKRRAGNGGDAAAKQASGPAGKAKPEEAHGKEIKPKGDDDRGLGIGSVMRAAAISEKPGAHPNRLQVLLDFFRKLGEQGLNPEDLN
jgi:hypothetical protein